MDLSPASIDDINYLKDIKLQIRDYTLLGDRGYLSTKIQLNLFETYDIKLKTLMWSNQKDYKEQPYLYRKKRKRIETLFSQLCDQLMIKCSYAKILNGLETRTLGEITAQTTLSKTTYLYLVEILIILKLAIFKMHSGFLF